MIKSIEKSSVHRITSGQVLVDLQTAVKELVENSLDAGATSIDVKFKDYGVKSFEVSDNGNGIAPVDYEGVAMKHWTSKLASFEDLALVETFGFRGEAISSLCALSERVTITTATASEAPKGTILDFDKMGQLASKTGKMARQKGTTVSVEGIFAPLPVRHKEFKKNAKREFCKALNLLNAYALVPCSKESQGVRLNVVNILDKGRRTDQLRTEGKPSLRSSISSLWGVKQLDALTKLDLDLEVMPEKSVLKRQLADDTPTKIKVQGFMSKFSPGHGRTSSDRQFLYVNGRPAALPKLQKIFNEVYRSFNITQCPFVVADFILPTHSCDINVSPDKRTILLHSEGAIVLALKASLEDLGESKRDFVVQSTHAQTQSVPPAMQLPRQLSSRMDDMRSEGFSRNDAIAIVDASDDPGDTSLASIPTTPSSDAQTPEAVEDADRNTDHILDENILNALDDERNPMHLPATVIRDTSAFTSSEDTVPFLPSIKPSKPDEPLNHTKRPIQMTLSTVHASWNLRPTDGSVRVTKRRKLDVDHHLDRDEGNEKSGSGRRASFRSQLSSFASSATQELKQSEDDKEEEDAEQVDDSNNIDDHDLGEDQNADRTKVVDPDGSLRHEEAVEEADAILEPVQIASESSTEEDATPGDTRPLFDDTIPDIFLPEPDDDPAPASAPPKAKVGLVAVGTADTALSVEASDSRSRSRTTSTGDSGVDSEDASEILRTAKSLASADMPCEIDSISRAWLSDNEPPPGVSGSSQADECNVANDIVATVGTSAGITNISDEGSAERELARVIAKEDFASMDIIGQFNLGFVIVRKCTDKTDDLFIVDQHAADEKYNFETLQQTTKIESQKLLRPRALELTATDEIFVVENIDVLKANGFEVTIDEDVDRSEGRVKLVAQPVSGSTSFDMRDLEELLHLMHDRPTGQMVRCSKARAMFAMRACRKSVMIGRPLNRAQMTSIVRHMGSMDQPWNCPHGRPTMRHLVGLEEFDTAAGNDAGHGSKVVDWSGL